MYVCLFVCSFARLFDFVFVLSDLMFCFFVCLFV